MDNQGKKKKTTNPNCYPVIQTARSMDAINEAARRGFDIVFKKVEESYKIMNYFEVLRKRDNGEVRVLVNAPFDECGLVCDKKYHEVVIYFRPYIANKYEIPIGAYLVPPDLQQGSWVYLEDLLTDYVETVHRQGYIYTTRLKGCEAVWNGADFEIQYDKMKNRTIIIH